MDINLGKPENWEYLNEGNLNVICRYVGADLNLKGYVLRMKKNTYSTTFNENYGIPEAEYREFFFKALQCFPKLMAFFPEDVLFNHNNNKSISYPANRSEYYLVRNSLIR